MPACTRTVFAVVLMLLASVARGEAQARGPVGSVVDEAGAPLPGVELMIVGTTLATVTRDDGTFSFTSPGAGHQMVMVRKLGFIEEAFSIDVLPRDTTTVAFQLERVAQTLPGVTVETRPVRDKLELNGFYSRQRSGIAPQRQFVTPADMMKRGVTTVGQMLDYMSQRVKQCKGGNVFTDGSLMDWGLSLTPDEVAGMEVYVGPAAVPEQFNLISGITLRKKKSSDIAGCAIVIWTR